MKKKDERKENEKWKEGKNECTTYMCTVRINIIVLLETIYIICPNELKKNHASHHIKKFHFYFYFFSTKYRFFFQYNMTCF